MAHADLLALRVELFAYEPFASRVWELRENVTAYDAWYVALAESLATTLATVDLKLSCAPGPRCSFATPPGRSSDLLLGPAGDLRPRAVARNGPGFSAATGRRAAPNMSGTRRAPDL